MCKMGVRFSGEATRRLIHDNLANAAFEFVHIQDLQTSAGRQTRRGKAEFRVYAKGTLRTPMANYTVGTANSTWSLGFQETEPGVWKVNRITPVSMAEGMVFVPQSPGSSKKGGGQGHVNRRGPEMPIPRVRPNNARYLRRWAFLRLFPRTAAKNRVERQFFQSSPRGFVRSPEHPVGTTRSISIG